VFFCDLQSNAAKTMSARPIYSFVRYILRPGLILHECDDITDIVRISLDIVLSRTFTGVSCSYLAQHSIGITHFGGDSCRLVPQQGHSAALSPKRQSFGPIIRYNDRIELPGLYHLNGV